MTEILARCGYRCDLCPAYLKNLHSFEDRQRVSDGWVKYVGVKVPPEQLGCHGCLEKGQSPDPGCPIRPCVLEQGLENCAYCEEFSCCDKLDSRMNFMEKRYGDFSGIPEDDFHRFIQPYLSKERLLAIWKGVNAKRKGGKRA
jgi:hypothetical protein